jgi:hypothetical protein
MWIFISRSLLLISLFYSIHGLISNLDFTSTGPSVHTVYESFGMSAVGIIDIQYEVGPLYPDLSQSAPILLIIINEGQRLGYYYHLTDNPCNRPTLFRQIIYGKGNITYYTTRGADQYTVLAVQCRDGNPDNPVHVSITATLKNPYPYGSKYQYLSIDQTTYVTVLEGLLISYFVLLTGIGFQIYFSQ